MTLDSPRALDTEQDTGRWRGLCTLQEMLNIKRNARQDAGREARRWTLLLKRTLEVSREEAGRWILHRTLGAGQHAADYIVVTGMSTFPCVLRLCMGTLPSRFLCREHVIRERYLASGLLVFRDCLRAPMRH